ncbi:MAG: ParA family protein [Myxococcota bacterium]
MSRFLKSVGEAEGNRGRNHFAWERIDRAAGERPYRVLAVVSNKGGVGKTTVATNLAVYLRGLREDLPILVVGFDEQPTIDRMFSLGPNGGAESVCAGMRSGSFSSASRLGQYGVHYVPTDPSVAELKREIWSHEHLEQVLHHTGWQGLVIVDTKSDLEILTRNALSASDLAIVVVKDRASVIEAARVYELMEGWRRPRDRVRILLSLVDLRVRYANGGNKDVLALLVEEIRRQGYPMFRTFLSRSPKIESLHTNPEATNLSILHNAPGSLVHRQMLYLAEEVLEALDLTGAKSEAAAGASAGRPLHA